MSILFCTPTYGGQITAPCWRSYAELMQHLGSMGMLHGVLRGSNESLVTRARSEMTRTFLKETDYESLMWIDADIEFTPDDVAKLWNMDKDVAVGIYRMKQPGSVYAAWVDGKLLSDLDGLPNPCEVTYAGTGFMMIKRTVIEQMWNRYPGLMYEGANGMVCHIFGEEIRDHCLLSDDYAFCARWRDLGGRIMADPTVRLVHWGQHGYGVDT